MISVRNATHSDIPSLHGLEEFIQGKEADSENTLTTHLEFFPQGFLVGEYDNETVGYTKSCILTSDVPVEERIAYTSGKDFHFYHNDHGSILYILFVGVHPDYRRKGIGSELVNKLLAYATHQNLKEVYLLSQKDLTTRFYAPLGFIPIVEGLINPQAEIGVLMNYIIQTAPHCTSH